MRTQLNHFDMSTSNEYPSIIFTNTLCVPIVKLTIYATDIGVCAVTFEDKMKRISSKKENS